MSSPEHKIISAFSGKRRVYEDLGVTIESLIRKLIIASGVDVHSIHHRVKDSTSLTGKLLRNHYNSLDEITDLLGIRIIAKFVDDVDRISGIINSEFSVDNQNSIDKRTNTNPAEFGYSSLHLIALLNSERLALTENKQFKGMKFEIQIRTILQNAWSEIEHDFIYKPHSTVPPEVRRLFYRMAALLEVADLDFQRARDIIEAKSNAVLSEDTPLDGKSILKFAEDQKFIALEAELESYWKNATKTVKDLEYLRTYAAHLTEWGMTTIGELKDQLDQKKKAIIAFSEYKSQHIKNDQYPFGWSLMQFAQILHAEDGSEDGIRTVVSSAYNPNSEDIKDRYNVIRGILYPSKTE